MLFGNPVHGPIHAKGWTRPTGNIEFAVSQKYGCTGYTAERPLGSCAHFHRAIDLSNRRAGAPVLAAGPGKVRYRGTLNSGARVVLIDHGAGVWTEYGHLASFAVSLGAVVHPGQTIGYVGSSGASAAHLHFGLKTGLVIGASYSSSVVAARFYNDSLGHWADPWPQLVQNVTVHPMTAVTGVNIRQTAGSGTTAGAKFASTAADGQIHRISDGAGLGETAHARKWGGQVDGASYDIDGKAGSTWERIDLDGAYRYIASPLAVRSAS